MVKLIREGKEDFKTKDIIDKLSKELSDTINLDLLQYVLSSLSNNDYISNKRIIQIIKDNGCKLNVSKVINKIKYMFKVSCNDSSFTISAIGNNGFESEIYHFWDDSSFSQISYKLKLLLEEVVDNAYSNDIPILDHLVMLLASGTYGIDKFKFTLNKYLNSYSEIANVDINDKYLLILWSSNYAHQDLEVLESSNDINYFNSIIDSMCNKFLHTNEDYQTSIYYQIINLQTLEEIECKRISDDGIIDWK